MVPSINLYGFIFMLNFLELEVRNFLSYGNVPTKITLDHSGVVLISGGNGVGKTSILNALLFALYGDTLNGCNADDLINNINKQQMEVSVVFHKKNVGYYKVTRARKMKSGSSGNYVQVFHNKEQIFDNCEITLDGTRTTDQLITSILGIPYDMFTRIVAISAINTAFLDIPTTQQTGFIERLFDLHILAEKAQLLKTSIKSTEDLIKDQLNKIEQIKKEQDRLNQQILNAKQRSSQHQENVQKQIENYQQQLNLIEQVDIDKERDIHNKTSDLKTQIKKFEQQKSVLSAQHQKYIQLKEKHTKELLFLKSSKCPYCEQHFHSEEKINECHDIIIECETNIKDMLEYLGELDKDLISTYDNHQLLISELTVNNIEELLNIKNKSELIKEKIKDLHNSKNVYLEQLAELENIELDECDYSGVDKLTNIVDHQQFLLKLLSKKDSFIRKNLLKTNLSYLNQRLEHYLSDLEMPYHVEFNTNMTADIKYLGRQLTFNNLSNGQKARVNIALTMAFRDVRQKMSYPVNICFQDEILDMGIDSAGMNAAIAMLKKAAKEHNTTFFVVTHRDETTSQFDKIMKISLEKDFSKISIL